MDQIIKILMERDGVTKEEATDRYNDVVEQFEACNYEPCECDNILMDMLSLEMDYLECFI